MRYIASSGLKKIMIIARWYRCCCNSIVHLSFILHWRTMDWIWRWKAQVVANTSVCCTVGRRNMQWTHFQILQTKTVQGTKFQPNQRNYNILPFLPFWGKNYKLFKNGPHFQILQTKTVQGKKFQPNQRNYNILPFLPFWSKNYKLFKNGLHFQILCTKTVLGAKFQPNQRNY